MGESEWVGERSIVCAELGLGTLTLTITLTLTLTLTQGLVSEP